MWQLLYAHIIMVYSTPDTRYLGCYLDDEEYPDFSLSVWEEREEKSAHVCVEECAKRGYKYAGVQNGGACFCGNTFGQYGGANETDCDVRCSTWGSENCGGVEKNAVYITELGTTCTVLSCHVNSQIFSITFTDNWYSFDPKNA